MRPLAGIGQVQARSLWLAVGVAILLPVIPLPSAVAARAARHPVCRVPPLTGLVLSAARERAKRAGCGLRTTGSPIESPFVQTIAGQTPERGRHARVIVVKVNPLCHSMGAPGPPAGEPFLTPGPTELVTGFYLAGGPLVPYSEPRCRPRVGTPGAGVVTVRDATGVAVATQSVAKGQLASVPLPAGTYTVEGVFGEAIINDSNARSFPMTVQIPPGTTVRQDIVLNIP